MGMGMGGMMVGPSGTAVTPAAYPAGPYSFPNVQGAMAAMQQQQYYGGYGGYHYSSYTNPLADFMGECVCRGSIDQGLKHSASRTTSSDRVL